MARCHCGWVCEGNCIVCGWVEVSPNGICPVENCNKLTVGIHKYYSKECFNLGTKCVAEGCNNKKAGMRDYCMEHSVLWTQSNNQNLECISSGCINPRIKNTRFCSTKCYQTHNQSSTKIDHSNKGNASSTNSDKHFGKCNVTKCRNEVKGTANGGYCDSHKWLINQIICNQSGCSLPTKDGELFCFNHKPANRSTKTKKSDTSSTFNSKPSGKTSRETQDSVVHPCSICGKDNTAGRIAKGVGKTVGNTTMGVFGTLTFLTGGLTAPLMLGAGMIGARISGSAEQFDICAECRAK